ncbi:GrpB family protein [Streptomyces sp. NPDC059785]|uniref:GrpB family protein n=1 Tax=Streptomyces sp. NPDC059785 TaxID=3346945 RepID=UPI003663341C
MGEPVVETAEYDPRWPERAAAAIAELRDVLRETLTGIEHIGSTAVPGLAAKPVIDLMAAADDLAAVEARDRTLRAALGYRRHFNGMTDRLLYVRASDGRRTHILHVVTTESRPTRNQRLLRDHLREHSRDAARYADLKRSPAAAGTVPAACTRAKTELVQELSDQARARLGLPSVPVREKTAHGPRP